MSVQALSWVIGRSKARRGDLLVAIMIANHAHSDGSGAFPSLATLAAETRLSRREVVYCIHRLEAMGELEVTREREKPNSYRLTMSSATIAPGSETTAPPPSATIAPGSAISDKKVVQPLHPNQKIEPSYNLNTPPLPPSRGASRPKKPDAYAPAYTEKFTAFWEIYPRTNGSKAEAFKAWRKQPACENGNYDTVLSSLRQYVSCPQWIEGYVPHAATWINQRRWETPPNMEERKREIKHNFNFDE